MKSYSQITKLGIVIFALLTGGAGYLLSLESASTFSLEHFPFFILGFYFVCSGSFILNQAQEYKIDQKMERTKMRPIANGKISPLQGYILSFWFILFGSFVLILLKPLTAYLTLLTVVLYNFCYTLWWKQKWSLGALLGALPGALPPVIGYSLGGNSILTKECLYLFLIMFLWQIPHFLSLAIRYQEDYKKAGIPVLPVISNTKQTIYEIGLYTIAYLGLALMSPLFLRVGLMYIFLLIPLIFKVSLEFYNYFRNKSSWLQFFIWINVSILLCVVVPVFDKWIFNYLVQYSL